MQSKKKFLISIFALSIFLIQTFIPVYSIEPNCNTGTPICPSGSSPACTNGLPGQVICSGIFGPSCQTNIAIFPGAVTCSSTSTSGCIICPQVIPLCQPGYELIPQTCTQCAHCELIICTPPPCVAPPPNCNYINIPKDENGCPIGCGTLVCSSSSSSGGNSCKCPTGQYYDNINNQCISGVMLCPLCPSNSSVCGCDGMTYCSSCAAYAAGVKTFTSGACGSTSSSSSGSSTCLCSQEVLESLCSSSNFSRTCSNNQVVCCPLGGLGPCRLLTCTTSSSSSSGSQCIVDSNCSLGVCPNGMTYQKYNCINNQCILINYLIDPCLNNSSSSSGSTSQCGSATCRNGEVCVVIDPCRGRPNCTGQISQFCALPNAIPSCSNGQIMCNTGSPVCNNASINIPTCGSSIGFSNDLSGPGCTNPDRTTLSVNSAYCSTSTLRTPDESKLSCTTKKLCPQGKRFESCREDRHNCKCICSFDARNDKGTPRCNKQNNAICSHGLKPTCSNSNNTASCYSSKLTCASTIDGSIDLIDTIECK